MNMNLKKKPWLSDSSSNPLQHHIQNSDLTTADILERESKNKKWSDAKRLSPFSEMSRRDEGDGRSIADSSCSSYTGFRLTGDKGAKVMARLRSAPLNAPLSSQVSLQRKQT